MKKLNFLNGWPILALAIIALAFFSSPVMATTLCEEHQGETYQIITGGTPSSNGLISGQTGIKIWLQGTLTIDQQFTMNGWIIKSDPQVAIIINENVGLVVKHSDLFCCSNLWNGIILKQNRLARG